MTNRAARIEALIAKRREEANARYFAKVEARKKAAS